MEEGKKKSKQQEFKTMAGVYVGETGCSIYERAGEHHQDALTYKTDSHRIKHWQLDHPELESPPTFRIKVVGSFSDALTRQVSESVRINMRGGNVINSKTEYSRCRLPRLTIDMEEWNSKKKDEKQAMGSEKVALESEARKETVWMKDNGAAWQLGLGMKKPEKRHIEETGGRRAKRKKLEGWGESVQEEEVDIRTCLLTDAGADDQADIVSGECSILLERKSTPRMKQLELNFSKVLTSPERGDQDDHPGVGESENGSNEVDVEIRMDVEIEATERKETPKKTKTK